MPIANGQDARKVDRGMQNILAPPNIDERLRMFCMPCLRKS